MGFAGTNNAAGRLSKVGSAVVSTEPDGNVTAVGADSHAYNTADALTAATIGGKAATYAVNADGQRVAVTNGGARRSWSSMSPRTCQVCWLRQVTATPGTPLVV